MHGRYGTYTIHRCRCDACTEALRRYMRDYRSSRPGSARTLAEAAQDREAAMTYEERRARSLRSWATRRRNAADR